METAIVTAVRVAGSLFVLRWAFAGGLIALLTDFSDLFLKNLLDLGGIHNYQAWDKIVDQLYLALFMLVALRWAPLPRTIAGVLYLYRLAGFAVFEIAGERWVLLLFPNLFEFWFLFVASLPHWRPAFRFTRRNVAVAGSLLLVAKEFQEYALHYAKWLDSFTAVEAVEAIWEFVTGPFR